MEKRPNSAVICHVRPCENSIDEGETALPTKQVDLNASVITARKEEVTDSYKVREGVEASHLSVEYENQNSGSGEVSAFSENENARNSKTDAFAAAETVIAAPFTKHFRKKGPTVRSKISTRIVKTTVRTTLKPTTLPTTIPTTTEAQSICKDTFKRAYCSIILRIGFCKFTTYRKRCCFSCEKGNIR